MGFKCLVFTFLVCSLPAMVVTAPLPIMNDATPNDPEVCRTEYIDGRLTVDCSDRGLTEFPTGLNINARILQLTNNNFATFPLELEEFSDLEELSLAGNHLSDKLPDYLQTWPRLSVLNLSNNNFEAWTRYELKSVTHLDLSRNKISDIDETVFSGMQLLFYLDMSENRISSLPTNLFTQTYNLDTLILNRNQFTEIPNFRSFSLRYLDLSSCQINTLRNDSFYGKSSISEVNISINEIDTIPDNIASTSLQVLDLSYNEISTISDLTFSSLPYLTVLDLSGNGFREIWSPSHFSSNAFLKEVRVKGNRWNCEHFEFNLISMYEFLTKYPPKVTDTTSLMCYFPTNVTQMTWQQAYLKTWHQEESYDFTITGIMIGVIIGIILTSFVCRCLMGVASSSTSNRPHAEAANLNTNVTIETVSRTETVVLRIPISEDLPPTYDEALLMPMLNSSFHSLPGVLEDDSEVNDIRQFRRSRSIGDLIESRQRDRDRDLSGRSLRIEE